MTTASLPRPMKFQSLQDFVYGSSSDMSADLRKNLPQTPFTYKPKQSLFDRYNRNNLTLNECNKKHLQIISKPIILSEQNLHITNQLMAKTFNKTNFSNKKQQFSQNEVIYDQKFKTGLVFPSSNANYHEQSNNKNNLFQIPKKIQIKTSQGFYNHQNKKEQSNQFKQNQLLFNFKKMAEEKRQKKKAFLQDIEAKIAMIQNQANQIEDAQFEEKCQISQLQNMHKKINQEIAHNAFVGQVKHQAFLNLEEQQERQRQKPLSINMFMEPNQINHVLQGHYQQNQKLLEEIAKVQTKSNGFALHQIEKNINKSKQKEFYKSDRSNSFNKTMKKMSQKNIPIQNSQQKKLISTTNTMKLPPKNKFNNKK